MEGVGLIVKNEFVEECNLILLLTEGCMQNFITLGYPLLEEVKFNDKYIIVGGEGGYHKFV